MGKLTPEQKKANKLLITAWVLMPACGLFGLGAGVQAGFSVHYYLESKRSGNWSHTTGQITTSEVKKQKLIEATGPQSGSHSSSRGAIGTRGGSTTVHYGYTPTVRYSYRVKGKEYQGTRIEVHDNRVKHETGRRRAVEILRDFPVGKTVKVYYDPKVPSRSLLKPGLTPGRSGDLIFYFALTAVFLAAAVVGFFLRRKAIRDGADLSSDDW